MVQRLLDDYDTRGRSTSEVEDSRVDSFRFAHISRNLVQLLYGKVDPLDLMFRNGLANRYYG